jgi:hypothetical protein
MTTIVRPTSKQIGMKGHVKLKKIARDVDDKYVAMAPQTISFRPCPRHWPGKRDRNSLDGRVERDGQQEEMT